jgi:hypothetical protein
MAIEYLEKWKEDEKSSDDRTKESQGIFENPIFDDETLGVQKLYDKVAELTDLINAHATKVAANDAKVTFPGLGTSGSTALAGNTSLLALGTSGSTALAGDTTTISSSQASAITASTSHNTKLNVAAAAGSTKSTAITFGEFTTTVVGKTTTYSLPVTVVETTVGKKGNTTLTKTGSITLT